MASNIFGTTLGADVTFTALATVPLAVTNPVSGVTANSATLNGQASQRGDRMHAPPTIPLILSDGSRKGRTSTLQIGKSGA